MKYFMLDIETLGTDIEKHDIIQIGLLELTNVAGLYRPGRSYVQTLFTDQETNDPWILEHHKELLPLARKAEYEAPTVTRAKILNFVRSCGVTDKFFVMGLNVASFDIPFCEKKGILRRNDYHYRVYELTGAYNLAQDVLGIDRRDTLFKMAHDACKDIELPAGKKHDALFDCYNQLKTINGITKLLR